MHLVIQNMLSPKFILYDSGLQFSMRCHQIELYKSWEDCDDYETHIISSLILTMNEDYDHRY